MTNLSHFEPGLIYYTYGDGERECGALALFAGYPNTAAAFFNKILAEQHTHTGARFIVSASLAVYFAFE